MKKIPNILLFFSILIFVISVFVHWRQEYAGAIAYPVGDGAGRISSVTYIPPSSPPTTEPCPNLHYYTLFAPSSGMVNQACFPQVNMPVTGLPIGPNSIGLQIIGKWTATYPTAVSANWGTSYR